MRPRPAALLTPPSQTPAFLQNVAKSCICHTSEKSPVTPIIASDPKTRSCKSCVCHTCDPLPPSSIASPSPLPSLATSHSPLPGSLARGCKFAPLFSSSCRMLPPQPFSFHAFAWLPGGWQGASPEACSRNVLFQESLHSLATFVPRICVSQHPNLGSGRRSRVRGLSYFPPVTSHESPVTAVVWGILSPLATSPVTSLECAVTKKVGGGAARPKSNFTGPRGAVWRSCGSAGGKWWESCQTPRTY